MVPFMTDNQKWIPCDKPKLGDTLRWTEPLWALPTKPRGKRDQIGEQEVTAILTIRTDFLVFEVTEVRQISEGDTILTVKPGDIIKRQKPSIQKGNCHKLIATE